MEENKNVKLPAANFPVLTDESEMPYGQHKGKKMINVPAKYLLWLWDNDKCSPSVREYINSNWEVLCKQAGRKPNRGVFSERVVRQNTQSRWGIDNPKNAKQIIGIQMEENKNMKLPAANFPVLTDESEMPYGQHKGKKMINVPAKDLLWLWDNDKCSPSVREYINSNWEVLCKQAGRKPNRGVFSERVVRQNTQSRWGIDNPKNAKSFRERQVPRNTRKLG